MFLAVKTEPAAEKEIPAELHIYAKAEHGFGAKVTDNHVGDWMNRVYYWMQKMGF